MKDIKAIGVVRILLAVTQKGSLLIDASRNSEVYDAIPSVGKAYIDVLVDAMIDAGLKLVQEDPNSETVTLVDNRAKDDTDFFTKENIIDTD